MLDWGLRGREGEGGASERERERERKKETEEWRDGRREREREREISNRYKSHARSAVREASPRRTRPYDHGLDD